MSKYLVLAVFLLSSCTYQPPSGGCKSFHCQRAYLLNKSRASFNPSKLKASTSNQKIAKKVKFSQLKFEPDRAGDGIWTGFLQGDGLARLKINFKKNGRIQLSKYIGSIELNRKEKPTYFRFKSHVPEDKKLSWEIENF